MSLKHAILGFLSIKPMTGYDLKKAFDQSIQYFWPANQSQIYRTLADLKAEGLVEQEVIAREDRLDMKVYRISDNGQDELHEWLSNPLPHQDYREAFLIQLYFGSKLDDSEVIPLLKQMIQDLQTSQDQLTAMYRMYQTKINQVDKPRQLFFSMLTLEYGLESNQTAIQWLTTVSQRLEVGDHTPLDLSHLTN
jgi:DNA-binding PadR family transcriptional regulator